MKNVLNFNGIKSIFSVVLLIGVTQAHAVMTSIDDSVVYESVGFIYDFGNISESFQIEHSGTYQATLTDFEFPDAFEILGLGVVNASDEMGRVSEEGSFVFDADPGTYYANLFAWTGDGLELGLYGIRISMLEDIGGVSPVPLPASIVLLMSALVALFSFGTRVKKYTDFGSYHNHLECA